MYCQQRYRTDDSATKLNYVCIVNSNTSNQICSTILSSFQRETEGVHGDKVDPKRNSVFRRRWKTTGIHSNHLRGEFRVTRDRCYDFLNIFAEKFSEKLAFLTQNKAKLCKKFIITLVLDKNAYFFAENCQKSQKIVMITSVPDWAIFHQFKWLFI
jgi:hypothetical protein